MAARKRHTTRGVKRQDDYDVDVVIVDEAHRESRSGWEAAVSKAALDGFLAGASAGADLGATGILTALRPPAPDALRADLDRIGQDFRVVIPPILGGLVEYSSSLSPGREAELHKTLEAALATIREKYETLIATPLAPIPGITHITPSDSFDALARSCDRHAGSFEVRTEIQQEALTALRDAVDESVERSLSEKLSSSLAERLLAALQSSSHDE